jgi:hypothetical protein
MTEEVKIPKARTPLEVSLGFRIDVRSDGEAGSVIWFTTEDRRSGVRPATGVEIRLWHALQAIIEFDGMPDYTIVAALKNQERT